jgi:hypothetical protein
MIKFLLATVLLLIVLSLLGVNVKEDIAENPTVQDNTSYVSVGVKTFWSNYLSGPAHFLWKDIFVDILWETFIRNMITLREGGTPTDFTNENAQRLPTIKGSIEKYGSVPAH